MFGNWQILRFRNARLRFTGYERRKRSRGPVFHDLLSRRLDRVAIGAEITRPSIPILPIIPISLVSLPKLAIGARTTVRKAVTLPVLPILPRGKTAPIILSGSVVGFELRSLNVGLRSVRRRVCRAWKRIVLLRKCICAFGRRSEPVGQGGVVIIIVELGRFAFSWRALTGLRERLGRLGGGNQSVIMFGVLQVVLCSDWIAAGMRVARQLKIFLCDMLRISANLYVWTIRFV